MKQSTRVFTGNNKLYFMGLLFLFSAGIISLLVFGKDFGSISIHAKHPFWINVFFINYTFMGNGLFAVCLASVFIFYFNRRKEGFALLYGFIISAIAIQLLKNIGNFTYPTLFIEQGQYLFSGEDASLTAPGIYVSGHTVIAFALATVFVSVAKKSYWQLPLLFAALLLAYSRMYLAQHFLSDVLIAVLAGTLSGIAAVYLAYKFKGLRYYLTGFFSSIKRRAVSMEENIQSA